MKKLSLIAIAAFMALGGPADAGDKIINGAGATFPYPLYSQWAYEYNQMTDEFNFQVIDATQHVETQQEQVREIIQQRIDLPRFRWRSRR